MEVIEYITEDISAPLQKSLEGLCDDADMAKIIKTKVCAITSLEIWKSYLKYIKSSNERNRKLIEDEDTVKLCWN